MEVSEVPSLLAIKFSLGRTSATVPMEEARHTLTPAQLLEQPRLLLQLVEARIRQCQARATALGSAREEMSRAKQLLQVSRSTTGRRRGLRKRLEQIPILQRIFMAMMLTAA